MAKNKKDNTTYILLGLAALGAVVFLPKFLKKKEVLGTELPLEPTITPVMPPSVIPVEPVPQEPYYVPPVIGTQVEVYTKTSPGVNVRKAPNTEAQIVSVAPRGSIWEVVDVKRGKSSNEWYWVQIGRRYGSALAVLGWVYGAYLILPFSD